MDKTTEEICGVVKELLHFGSKVKRLNLELAKDSIGTPLILFGDWTNKNKCKLLFQMHIKEAIELKTIIDNLVFSYHAEQMEKTILEAGNEK